MSDFSSVAPPPPQQNFPSQSSAFAAAVQRAKQIAAKINPGPTTPENRGSKRPLEDTSDPEPKKHSGMGAPSLGMGRSPQGGPPMGGPLSNGPPPMNDDLKPLNSGGIGSGGPSRMSGGPGGRNSIEIMLPGPKVGLIIGKGGETIKQLQEKSGAKMVVIQDGPGQELEKPLVISGDPQKVEYAKSLVYELIAEKEMKNFNNRGGARGPRNDRGNSGGGYDDFGGGDFEVLVPKAAVGVVIGKGGDMIKKIQNETGCRVQFQQARDEGPGDRRCFLSGNPKQIDQARQKIEELIDSVLQRDGGGYDGNGMGGGAGYGGRGGRGAGRTGRSGHYNNRGNDRNGGGGGDYGGNQGGWNDRGAPASQEVQFVVPANKCGVIIGKGGETIKQINQQSGAYCELDRRSNSNQSEKTFTIKGDPEAIETAKRIISDKIQMPINFINMNGGGNGPAGMNSNMPTAYPGMAPQGYNPQGWGMPSYGQQQQQQQQWSGHQNQGGVDVNNQNPAVAGNQAGAAAAVGVNVNPQTGQPDYSLQWAEYYRSLGMLREAEMIEQQAKAKAGGNIVPGVNPAPQAKAPVVAAQVAAPASGTTAGQPDYSSQWAEYYRSIGKIKEAEAIEAQMKNKANPATAVSGVGTAPGAAGGGAGGFQQSYAGYQAQSGYYGGQQQAPMSGGQQNYGFSQYGYGGQPAGGSQNPSESN
ncbi:hypothetical protein ABEB36_002988 [Hypothenemus hampei]|uniref:K Homology domain-containing protein n=1 Tax=Hypothenemus hampei TaxID=57062 RepID=A0ABD1F7N0_HYPHA